METPGAGDTVLAHVDVAVDAQTAFSVFTEEIDLWWVRGPINFFDAGRALAMRCEPGVGGRLMEVYSEEPPEFLEIGRITVWEPGCELAWQSAVDDVHIRVLFDAIAGGTRVTVAAEVKPGGRSQESISIARVMPRWFGAWTQRRDGSKRQVAETARLAITVSYRDPIAAARWLHAALALEFNSPLPEAADEPHTWIELRIADSVIAIVGGGTAAGLAGNIVPWIHVDDLDAHYSNAVALGATIVQGIHQHGYRAYVVQDLEGNRWTIAQARPTMKSARLL